MNSYNYLLSKSEGVVEEIFRELNVSPEGPSISKVMPLLLFRKIIEKFKAIEVLRDNACGEPSLTLARTLVENYWYLMFMIKEDSEFRSLSYYYFDKREDASTGLKQLGYFELEYLKMIKKKEELLDSYRTNLLITQARGKKYALYRSFGELVDNTLQSVESKKKLALIHSSYDQELQDLTNEIKSLHEKIEEKEQEISKFKESILTLKENKKQHHATFKRLNTQKDFSEVRDEFSKAKTENKIKKPKWYTLKTGIETIHGVAVSLGLEHYYNDYSMLSREVHSLNATNQISVDAEKGVCILDLDNVYVSNLGLSMAQSFLSYSIEPFLKFYGKDKLREEIVSKMVELVKKEQFKPVK